MPARLAALKRQQGQILETVVQDGVSMRRLADQRHENILHRVDQAAEMRSKRDAEDDKFFSDAAKFSKTRVRGPDRPTDKPPLRQTVFF